MIEYAGMIQGSTVWPHACRAAGMRLSWIDRWTEQLHAVREVSEREEDCAGLGSRVALRAGYRQPHADNPAYDNVPPTGTIETR